MLRILVTCMVVALAGCAGASGGPGSPQPPPSGPITFSSEPGLVCCPGSYTLTVQTNGSATKTASGQSTTMQLSPPLTSQIFSDATAALPLSALAADAVPDSGALTVTWGSQTTPNISAANSGIEGALVTDFKNASAVFGP